MFSKFLPATILVLFVACVATQGARSQGRYPRDVTITPIPAVIDAHAQWRLVWQGTDNADGLVGIDDGGILFAQEQPNRIGRLDENDAYSVFLSGTRGAGSLSIAGNGALLAVERTCTDPGRRNGAACLEPTAVSILLPERRVLADNYGGQPLGRLNDLVADRLGGAYFTAGGAYHVDAHGRVSSLGTDLSTNGIMLEPDEKTLYVTNRDVIVAFDVADDGSTSNRRIFARLEAGGVGDGMTVDAAGRLYVTSGPGVQVLGVDGAYLGLIPTPRNAISVAFAGPYRRSLYVVGGGASLGPNGAEFTTPEGVRNNAKSIYKIEMLAEGSPGRGK